MNKMGFRKDNRGFTMVELLTAIGILAVISVTIVYMMISSSNTYSRLSVEAQLQSEAQLVANSITEMAIDAYDAESSIAVAGLDLSDYDTEAGKVIALSSTVEGVEKIYLVARKNSADNELYLIEGTEVSEGTYSWTFSLLGNNVASFDADTSRVEKENMITFDIGYKKNDREYVGKYQVLMRNREYADEQTPGTPQEESDRLSIGVSPKVVYIDVVNNSIPSYYVNKISPENKRSMTDQGIRFTASVASNRADKTDTVTWKLINEDSDIFYLSETSESQDNYLLWTDATKSLYDSPIDGFTLNITKTMPGRNGADPVSADPKTAQILMRRVKSVTLNALSGVSQWKSLWTEEYSGKQQAEAQGYAYYGNDGKLIPVSLNASILSTNVSYGGGLTWQLFVKDESSGDWQPCTDSNVAALANNRTETATTNQVNFGSAASNGQLFKVVATSIFDPYGPNNTDEYIFGVAPKADDGDDSGFYSRGYYTNMSSFLKTEVVRTQGDAPAISKVVYLKCTGVTGANADQDPAIMDKIKITCDADGNWRLYLDFNAFSFSADQKKSFYGDSLEIHLCIGYYGEDGKLYISGGGENEKAEMAAMIAKDSSVADKTITSRGQEYKYHPKPVEVTKVSPVSSEYLVVAKGKDKTVRVKTSYYNIISPRKGTYFFGVYLDNMTNNLLKPGASDINAYFSIAMLSEYGDIDNYIEQARVSIAAKSLSAQKKYPTDPLTFRLTANDYYLINPSSPDSRSYTDYKAVIANVEGLECYMSGPETTVAPFNWNNSVTDATKKEIKGLDEDGNIVTAQAYKSGNKYMCEFRGRTYTYNVTYNYWAN